MGAHLGGRMVSKDARKGGELLGLLVENLAKETEGSKGPAQWWFSGDDDLGGTLGGGQRRRRKWGNWRGGDQAVGHISLETLEGGSQVWQARHGNTHLPYGIEMLPRWIHIGQERDTARGEEEGAGGGGGPQGQGGQRVGDPGKRDMHAGD
ncbi:hypothetical protein CMUS01_12675 [Colletotrichum musicola]|uniref:Uncharacterized protein n=1 Tax=Colletotrichum musicola TaxID=2175873 RepID=A0A8H6MZR9_9PEZI|nr:hypothetical protein CMUS01_12675 [Colletotrichum musicola]